MLFSDFSSNALVISSCENRYEEVAYWPITVLSVVAASLNQILSVHMLLFCIYKNDVVIMGGMPSNHTFTKSGQIFC